MGPVTDTYLNESPEPRRALGRTMDPETVPLDARIASKEPVWLLGKDSITGAEWWHRHGRIEVRHPNGTLDIVEGQ
jgi:hypothetical protein